MNQFALIMLLIQALFLVLKLTLIVILD